MPPAPDRPPLTHHEILRRVEPFARHGLVPDLAATDRAARRIAARPRAVEIGAPAIGPGPGDSGAQTVTETVWLESDAADDAAVRVRRELRAADGLVASLVVEDDDAGRALERLAAVAPARQFRDAGAGTAPAPVRIALAQRLERGADPAAPTLIGAQANLPGLTIAMTVSRVPGYPAELELRRATAAHDMARAPADLPDDLLAVLGGAWSRLTPMKDGWRASVALRGRGARRSADAETRLVATLQHLVATLAEPPARFHARHRGARWRLALADVKPWAIGIGIVGFAWWLQRDGPENASALAMLANLAPPLLMMMFFLRREMPRIGLPRLPRGPAASAWQPIAAGGTERDGPAPSGDRPSTPTR